jgi:tellurite methyltransferase
MSVEKKDWKEYYSITKNSPPTPLLIKALEYVVNKKKAIDIGAGALKDTRHLLQNGFNVTAVDSSELMAEEAQQIKSENLKYFVSDFSDIASAMYSLPFILPKDFENVLVNIKHSLVKGGIFCGQFFGCNDDWSANPKMNFHTRESVGKLLSDMEIIFLEEREKDGETANGTLKHWHVFDFIARKIS